VTFSLKGKTVLVAGASSGIGAGFSRAIAKPGGASSSGRGGLNARRRSRPKSRAKEAKPSAYRST